MEVYNNTTLIQQDNRVQAKQSESRPVANNGTTSFDKYVDYYALRFHGWSSASLITACREYHALVAITP
jgi:hypothetical protein